MDSLIDSAHAAELWRRWDSLQTELVENPEGVLEQADQLVDEAMQRLKDALAGHRRWVQARWVRGEQVTGQDLRQALRYYETFFRQVLGPDPDEAGRHAQLPEEAAPGVSAMVTQAGGASPAGSRETPTESRDMGDVIEIPIVEEELVKRPVVKEVVRVRKSELTDQQTIAADRRVEDVEVETQTDTDAVDRA